MIVRVITLGCKVNQCESASIIAALRAQNYTASEGLAPADVFVLNTCSVTAEADKKSRQYIAKMHKLNPNCSIIVVGCSSQNLPEKFHKSNVIAIGGTANKVGFVIDIINKLSIDNHYNTLSDIIVSDNLVQTSAYFTEYCYEPYPLSDKTRAFIKIQDGCNRFCTYCIIPYLRGRSRSRSIDDIVCECRGVESKEIVLTGIDISSYGKDIGTDFCALLSALSDIKARKRLGSLECEVIDERLLDIMAEGNYCPHFHLSLQNGSDDVLKSMNRRYGIDLYYKKIQLVRKYFPLAGITTDIIVGFPTETDNLFEDSCSFIESCGFSDIHVFPYSSRAGTVASKKYRDLSSGLVKKRVNRLLNIKQKLHSAFLSQNIGVSSDVYVEETEGDYNVGYTPNYIKVYSKAPCGDIVNLKLTEISDDGSGLIGI